VATRAAAAPQGCPAEVATTARASAALVAAPLRAAVEENGEGVPFKEELSTLIPDASKSV